jgi:hypothetical protein
VSPIKFEICLGMLVVVAIAMEEIKLGIGSLLLEVQNLFFFFSHLPLAQSIFISKEERHG